jgi:ATPase subunit of ABC transporter with duplicated ATPase domains
VGIIPKPIPENSKKNHTKLPSVATGTTSVTETSDIESLFSKNDTRTSSKKGGRQNLSGASSISSGVRLENISKSFKGVTLLKDVSWEVKKGEKVGLVGVNGAGKTTQLKIIVGEEEPDSGQVIKAKHNMKLAFLTQEFEVVPTRTVREEFLNAFKDQLEVQQKIDRIQKALESAVDDMDLMGRLLDELDFLQKQADVVELYDVDVKINKMMPELGFSQEDGDRLVASFSGGWQMRISLGKILLQEPDLLLLDEPTNHLDLDTIEWLEGYLKKQDVPMVVVSHDRAFLDQLCTKIVETDMGISKTYEGNYSEYVAAKAAWIEAQRMAWEKQQKEINHTKDMINRLSAGASSGRASSAEKKLEKLQDENSVEKPFEHKPIKFRFPALERSGNTVVMIKNLAFEYDGNVLFKKANLMIERGEKLAVIGPNGCGKSTLLRLIMGYEEPTHGQVQLGEHNVIPNYFEQNQAEVLDLDKTVLETVEMAAENWRIDDIKGLLGRCNFKADMLNRKVAFLSGGEKARLAFCKFMVTPSTLLVLDEPTNHLDIPSKELLEEAIREYRGTVIAVSHDRYFLRQIVNRVVEVKDGMLWDYVGDYNYYLENNLEARKRELEREEELEAKAPKVKAKSKMSKAEKELRKKQKATSFQQSQAKTRVSKNAKRWN